jgi:hypothetical protein
MPDLAVPCGTTKTMAGIDEELASYRSSQIDHLKLDDVEEAVIVGCDR